MAPSARKTSAPTRRLGPTRAPPTTTRRLRTARPATPPEAPTGTAKTRKAAAAKTPPRSDLEPACIVVPDAIDFGSGAVGDTGEVVFRIENCGGLDNDNLLISNVYFVDDAAVQSSPSLSLANNPPFPLSIGPFDAWPFQVRFRPTAAGRASGVIRVESNAADRPSIDIPVEAIAE